MRIIDIVQDTIVDGIGLRTSVYCAGCRHQCPGCHNESTWSFDAGYDITVDALFDILAKTPNSITFSGGDPMYQAVEFAKLAKKLKAIGKNIWCYTGFAFEHAVNEPQMRALLSYIDVLVDGPYMQQLRSTDLLFRGSANQRIIDVQKSIAAKSIVLYALNTEPNFDE